MKPSIVVAAACVLAACQPEEARGVPYMPGDASTSTGEDASSDPPGQPATSSASVTSSPPETSSSGDPGSDSTAHPDGSSSGGPDLTCPELGYEGTCVGEVLYWCEGDELMTHDCAADGEVCEWQSDEIGYNCLPMAGAFGYPVGDLVTPPAGGWTVTQVLGHYLNSGGFVGGHLAQDIAAGEAATAGASVHAVGPGEVLYAGPNASTYVNVVLIEHDLGADGVVCSFYGHLGSVTVNEGQIVDRGDQIATVLDWNAHFGAANSHLHYVMLSAELCAASDAANGALICGYDDTAGPNGIQTLDDEPYSYTSVGDPCGTHNYVDAFISPSQFIAAHP